MELVRPEQHCRRCRELRSQDRAHRDGPAALLDHRDRLCGRELPRPDPGYLLERGGDRLDRAEVGAGADDHGDARLAESAYSFGEEARRLRHRHLMSHVVAADQDDRDLGLDRQGPVDLLLELGGAGAHLAELAQVDPSAGVLGDAAGQDGAWGLLDPVDAVPGSARVAEQCDPDGRPGATSAVPTSCVGRRLVAGVADGPAGELGLGVEQAVEPGAQQRESADASCSGGCELACCRCLGHEPILRRPPGH